MSVEDIKNSTPTTETMDAVAELFKVLGDSTRAKILFALEQGPLCVNHICQCVDMTKYAVSHQLRILRQANLVKCKREGKEIIYALDDEHVSCIFECALEHVLECGKS